MLAADIPASLFGGPQEHGRDQKDMTHVSTHMAFLLEIIAVAPCGKVFVSNLFHSIPQSS